MPEDVQVNLYSLILGLPKEVTEPDHFQILGLPRFPADPKTIRVVAADQNGKILKWQNSRYFKASMELTRPVIEAKRVLGTPETRREYDESLGRSPQESAAAETQSFAKKPTLDRSPSPLRMVLVPIYPRGTGEFCSEG